MKSQAAGESYIMFLYKTFATLLSSQCTLHDQPSHQPHFDTLILSDSQHRSSSFSSRSFGILPFLARSAPSTLCSGNRHVSFCYNIARTSMTRHQIPHTSSSTEKILTLLGPVVTSWATSLTFSNSTFCPHSVFMCFVWI